ncbi:hypothetical protein J7I98_13655 [Streptomyces sp. ISL-98]|uniref:hypothetical protein n=1 Tax=Streptomyces sp. ISL-98 TaxID=2819192 RepID=UPI001BE94F2D|nr:hypothetical protein [Streptomyces sp. ISL-98]MBT2506919.1 hypothetical protein [Streptomyces sp. ISL-98]
MNAGVEDTATGRRGTLGAIAPDTDHRRLTASPMPRNGGVEWTTAPGALTSPAPITPGTAVLDRN